MKDIGAVLASLFVIFILISLLSVDDTQNSGLNSSLGKTSDSETSLEAILLHQLTLSGWHLSDGKDKKS
jgi:hypothetical protein